MKRFVIATVALALAAPAATASGHSTLHGTRHVRTAQKARESGQPVIDWNQNLLSIVNTPGAQPANIQPTWSFAILHAAIYDAVDSIDRSARALRDQRARPSRRVRDGGGRRRRPHRARRPLPGAAGRARRRVHG